MSYTPDAYTMTASLVCVFVVLSVCIAQAHSTASSEDALCVDSIHSSGTIVYSNANYSFSLNSDSSVHEIPNDTVVVLFTITVPPGDKENETKTFLYQGSKGNFMYYVTPELADMMTFYTLQLALRTQHISLDVCTFNTCEGKSMEMLLSEGFSMKNEGSLRSLPTYQHNLIWMAAFMVLGIMSATVAFGVLVPILDYITDRAIPFQHWIRWSQVLTTVNRLSLGWFQLYFSYILSCMILHYIEVRHFLSWRLEKGYIISPFTCNAFFLFMTLWLSFRVGRYLRKNSYSMVLLTAAIYHSPFLLFALVDDFSRVASSIVIQATSWICLYTLFPLDLQHYRVALRRKRYVYLCLAVFINIMIPGRYILTTIGTSYARFLASPSEILLFVVLVSFSIMCTFCFLLLGF